VGDLNSGELLEKKLTSTGIALMIDFLILNSIKLIMLLSGISAGINPTDMNLMIKQQSRFPNPQIL